MGTRYRRRRAARRSEAFALGSRAPDGSRLTDPQHADLLETARGFLWSMAVDPPDGRRRSSPSSLFTKAGALLTLIQWMVGEGFTTFRSLDRSAVDRYQAYVQQRRRPRPGKTSPITVGNYLRILKDLYHQSTKLPDALGFDPFPYTTAGLVAGVCRADAPRYPVHPRRRRDRSDVEGAALDRARDRRHSRTARAIRERLQGSPRAWSLRAQLRRHAIPCAARAAQRAASARSGWAPDCDQERSLIAA